MSVLANENCSLRLPHGPIHPRTLVLMLVPNNLLYVTVTSYEPYVDGDPTPITVLSEKSCQYVLSTMPVGKNFYHVQYEQVFAGDRPPSKSVRAWSVESSWCCGFRHYTARKFCALFQSTCHGTRRQQKSPI